MIGVKEVTFRTDLTGEKLVQVATIFIFARIFQQLNFKYYNLVLPW